MENLLTARKLTIRVAISAIVLAAVMLVCLLIGSEHVSLKAAIGGNAGSETVNPDYEILVHVRLPRVILAAIVGASLACAGAIFQALLRNPLADPYILGVSSGAGLGAITAVLSGFGWTVWGRSPIAVFAFCGAIGTVWLVWVIGRLAGKSQVTGLLLAGVIVNAFFSAMIMFLTSIAKSDQIHSTIFWLMGNMEEESFGILWISGGFLVAGMIALFNISPQLNIMSFGEEDAKSMGVNVRRIKTAAFVVASFVTAVAVSLSGLIGFVGLLVPHAVRLLFGPDHRQLIPLSGIVGAAFLVGADTLSRTIVAPAQLPVGVVTAIVGGPVFLILLVKFTRNIGWLDK